MTTMDPIRVLLVDDEPAARRGVRSFLAGRDGFEVVGECGDAEELLSVIEEHSPDLLFLDIRMPCGDERMAEACERARAAIRAERAEDYAGRIARLLADVAPGTAEPRPPARFVVRSAGRVTFVPVADVEWIEAVDDYVRLHTGEADHLMRGTMTALEEELDPAVFVRVHRSTIVRISAIRQVAMGSGSVDVVLSDGTHRSVSRSGRDKLETALGVSLTGSEPIALKDDADG